MNEIIEKMPEERDDKKDKSFSQDFETYVKNPEAGKEIQETIKKSKPVDIFPGAGIVTPSEVVKRTPRGDGKIGFDEEVVKAPMAGLTNRVPVGTDKFGKPIYGTLEEQGTKDIALQKQPMSYDVFKEKVLSGEITQATSAGSPYVLKIISDVLKNDKIDVNVKNLQEARLKTFYNYSQYKDPSLKIVQPFAREGKFVADEDDNPRRTISKKAFFDNQTDFLNVIKGRFTQFENPKDQTLIEQKLLNRISTGNTPRSALRVAIERFNEIPRALPVILPWAKYVYDYATTRFNPDLWEAGREERELFVQDMKQTLQSELAIPLLMDVMNDAIVEELKLDLKDGKITQEKFNELTQIKSGDMTFARQFVNEDLAIKILDKSFSQLSDDKKVGIYLFETGVPITGFGTISIKAGAAIAKGQVKLLREKVKKDLPTRESSRLLKLNDLEFVDEIKDLNFSKKSDIGFLVDGINIKSLVQSIQIDTVSKNAKKLSEKSYLAGVKYRSLIKDPNATQGEKNAALQMYRRYYAQMINDAIRLRTSPVLKAGLTDIAPMTAALYVGQEYLGENGMGGDTFTGELLGVAFYLMSKGAVSYTAGRVIKSADGLGGRVINEGAKVFEDLTGWLYTKTGGDAVPKGWLADRSQEDYERLLGRKLKTSELKGFEWTQKLVSYMGEENAAIVMDNIKADFQKRRKIANLFPDVIPEGQTGITNDEAYKILAGDIGETSRAQWLKTAIIFAQKNVGAFDGADPKTVKNVIELQKQLEYSAVAQSKAKDRILELAKEQGIDLKNNSIVNDFVNEVENRVEYSKQFNANFASKLKAKIKLYIDRIERNPSESSRGNFIQELKDAEIDLGKLIEGTEFDEVAEIDSQIKQSYVNLNATLERVKNNRANISLHADNSAKTTEKLISTVLNGRLAKARIPFRKLDEDMENSKEFIDIGGLVRSLVDDEEAFKGKPLSLFFSKRKGGKEFFDGFLNVKLRKSFQSMAKRSFDTLPESLKGKIHELATIEYATDGTKNPLFINADGDFTDFDLAVKLYDNRKNPDFGLENYRPFQATAFEVNAVRSAFRDYAYRIKDVDPQLSATYLTRKDELDDLFIKKMPERAEEYANARTGYKAIVFDDQDVTGDLNIIQSGVERTDENPEGFNFIYQDNKDPGILFDKISNMATQYIRSDGEPDVLQKLKKQFYNESRLFQDKTDDFTPAFDLTTPEGLDKLNVFKKLLQEKLYMQIGKEYFNVKSTVPRRYRERAIAERQGGYNFDKDLDADILRELDEAFVVTVIDPKLGKTTISLNPITDMMSETKDITNAVGESVELQNKLKNYLADLKTQMSLTEDVTKNTLNTLNADLDKIVRKFGDNTFEATPDGYLRFFMKHIVGGDPKKIERDKNFIVQQTKLSRERVDKLYQHMSANGLLEYGNPTTLDGDVMNPLVKGGDNTYEVFQNPAKIISVLADGSKSRALIETIISPTILDNVETLMKLVNGRRKLNILSDPKQMNTNLRRISQNELASRGYNIARDMVSPLYVTTEFALRIASQHGINVMNLAVTNEKASELLVMIMENPSNMTKVDLDTFDKLITNFVVQQMTRQNIAMPEFTTEGLESLRKQQLEEEEEEGEEINEDL